MQRLWLIGLTTLFVAASGIAKAQISDDVVKIGVLTDMYGPASHADRPGLGRPPRRWRSTISAARCWASRSSVISADHQIKPDIGAGIARQWYDSDTGRPDRRRAGLGGRPRGAERRQRSRSGC